MVPINNASQPKNNDSQPHKNHVDSVKNLGAVKVSFADVLNSGRIYPSKIDVTSPTIVLDDACLMERDFSSSLMGKIKDINAMPNLYLILANEGFDNVKITHLGGMWVLLDMDSIVVKDKILKHVGVGSWFNELQPACNSFVCDERITWISIEGLPITAFTRYTFAKIVSSSDELADVDEPESNILSYKRSCVKVKSNVTINDKVKIIVKGKIFWIRVEELETWAPHPKDDLVDNNKDVTTATSGYNDVLKHKSRGSLLDVMDELIKVGQTMGYNMEGCMKNIEAIIGSQRDYQELNTKHRFSLVALQETKLDRMDLFSNKALWGNLSFDYVFSLSVGFSGGILCVWDLNLFIKDSSTISDYSVAIRALCLDKHLSYHRPILMREMNVDYGLTPFRLFHSWFNKKALKTSIKQWIKEDKLHLSSAKEFIQNHLYNLDKSLDQGSCNDGLVNERSNLLKELQDLNSCASLDMIQKAKIRWAIEGNENTKYFHRIINKKRSQMAIRGVLVDGDWIVEPSNVKKEILNHFSNRFADPTSPRLILESQFPNTLYLDQQADHEREVSYDEIKKAVWDSDINKSPGPDGFTIKFFCRFWNIIDKDVVAAVSQFFSSGIYKGIPIDDTLILTHLFYADDVMFVGKRDTLKVNTIVNVLKCFFLASSLKIILHKSKLMGIGIPHSEVVLAAESLGPSLWSRLINAIYGPKGALDNQHIIPRCSPWLDIIREFIRLSLKGTNLFSFVKKMGNDEDTSFWDDSWLTDSLLKIIDRWIWNLESSGDFSVKSARVFIDDSLLPKSDTSTRWVNVVPIKINIFAWRVFLDKLPTRLNLSLRGVNIPSILCPLCSITVESSLHLLLSCHLARQLMLKVARW
ncbi:RNA-directed DNA polymerase, eukaryota [Tanacetum coccineum]|uniref:RNA-directed DNA polymerase, eukaryota n=1 Tax=Tanacetum coccineum TaxID=301880 RepID=A0ABQ5B438_9ASTR